MADFDDENFRVTRAAFRRGREPGAQPRRTRTHFASHAPYVPQGMPEWTDSSHVGRLYGGHQAPRAARGRTSQRKRLAARVRGEWAAFLKKFGNAVARPFRG